MVATARIYLILYGDELEVEMPRRRIGQEALHFLDSGVVDRPWISSLA